jgi:hypothetical protein
VGLRTWTSGGLSSARGAGGETHQVGRNGMIEKDLFHILGSILEILEIDPYNIGSYV